MYYYLIVFLLFLTLISQNFFLINEETLVGLAFVLFVVWIRQTQSQTLTNTIKQTKNEIENGLLKEVFINNNNLTDIKQKIQNDLTHLHTIDNIFNNLQISLSLKNDASIVQIHYLKSIDFNKSILFGFGFPIQTNTNTNPPLIKIKIKGRKKLLSCFFL